MAPALHWETWLPFFAFLLYAFLLTRYMGAYAGGSDSSGYLNNARLLSEGRLIAPLRLLPGLAPDSLPSFTHVPLGFIPNADRVTMTPTYPVGLPLLIMGAAQLVGWACAPGLVMGLHALVGLWLTLRMARGLGLEAGWAWLGVLLLAASPLYLFMSLQVMSDAPALVWVTAAVWLAWSSQQRIWLAVAGGFALGIAVLVRPSDLLAVVPVALALGWSLRRWLLLILGGLPGAVFLGYFNLTAYGRILTTGYGDVGGEFGCQYVPATLMHYAAWMPMVLTPLCLLALGLPVVWRRQPRVSAVLTFWVLPFFVFYLFYLHTHEAWWYLRFLLPAFPALIVATMLVGRALLNRLTTSWRPGWLVVAGIVIAVHGVAWGRHYYVLQAGHGERVYPETTAWLQAHLPANAVVASMQTSGAMLYYTRYTFFRWDMVSPADFARIAGACAATRRPIYAVLFPYEIEEKNWAAFEKHLTGHWVRIGAVRHVSIWRLDSLEALP
jgi:hypothetical protein